MSSTSFYFVKGIPLWQFPFQLLNCVYYATAGLPEEGQELVSLPPPSAAGRPSVQTSSVELAGATSSLGQVDCSGSPSQENSGQMVPSNVFQNGTSLFQGYDCSTFNYVLLFSCKCSFFFNLGIISVNYTYHRTYRTVDLYFPY